MAELPYDVWCHITSFLDSNTRRRLYSVNRPLFEIAMRDCYKVARVGVPPSVFSRNLVLYSPEHARRVQTLFIHKGRCYVNETGTKSEPSGVRLGRVCGKLKSLLGRSRDPVGQNPTTPSLDPLEVLLEIVPRLSSVSSLYVDSSSSEDPKFHSAKVSIVNIGWNAFGTNLTSLTLHLPLKDLHDIFPTQIRLEHLSTFSAQLSGLQSTSSEKLEVTLLPFLNAHRETLQSLQLVPQNGIDLSSLLRDVAHLPFLHTVILLQSHLPGPNTIPRRQLFSQYGAFLARHADHLRRLTIGLDGTYILFPSEEFFGDEWCSVTLPHLAALTMGLGYVNNMFSSTGMVEYLRRQAPTLVELKLEGCRASYKKVERLVSEFRPYSRLERFDLDVDSFSPQLLEVLADGLPRLRHLVLHFYNVSLEPTETMATNSSEEWATELEQKASFSLLHEWSLESLTLASACPLTSRPLVGEEVIPDRLKRALVAALPNVKYFCGIEREEYLASQDHACFRVTPGFFLRELGGWF